jgi:hypothetical protein
MSERHVTHLGPMNTQQFADHINAMLTVEQVAADSGLVHYHRAAFVRFTTDLAKNNPPNLSVDYRCECGEVVTDQPACMFCGQDAHHLCWNHTATVPGACPCPCYWEKR